jgi:hypothetical protein
MTWLKPTPQVPGNMSDHSSTMQAVKQEKQDKTSLL